jgi:hypothetical protein
MSKEIKKKSKLGEEINIAPTWNGYVSPKYHPDDVKETLKELDLKSIEQVEIENPITHQKSIVTIDREGTHDSKLIKALADKKMNRDQKDSVLAAYLFERGKESASFLAEIFRSKGQHTKETRAFTSQMRFDFEMFISLYSEQMKAIARDIAETYSIPDIQRFIDVYMETLKKTKNRGDALDEAINKTVPEWAGFIRRQDGLNLKIMIRNWTEAERVEEKVKAVSIARQKEKGYGIYIDSEGRPYSIFQDEAVDDIVKADIKRIKDLEND